MPSKSRRDRFFTNRQLTTMVVALSLSAAVVMLPGAVWAADQLRSVAIGDPVSGTTAEVDKGRRLVVGDGTGAMTVDGNVVARPAAPKDFWWSLKQVLGDGYCEILVTPPSGKAAVLTTLNFEVTSNPSPGMFDGYQITTGTTCGGRGVAIVMPPGLGHTTFPFEPGVTSTTGFSIRVFGEPVSWVTATGYYVPSAEL